MSPIQQMFLGGGKTTDPVYIDDVWSTFLWEGDGSSTRSINNGIDMSSEGGGMTWIKRRSSSRNNVIFDTERGATKRLIVNDNTTAEGTYTDELKSFTSTGFTIGSGGNVGSTNESYVSHTWKKQKGFFDIVTYSGNSSTQVINHNLGAMPGFIAVRDYSHGDYWTNVHCYDYSMHLHWALTNSEGSGNTYFNGVTSSTFTLTNNGITNQTGRTYVAYIFGGGPSQNATARSVDFAGGDSDDELHPPSALIPSGRDSNKFCLETWFKTDAAHADGMLYGQYVGGNAGRMFLQVQNNNPPWNIRLFVGGSDVINVSGAIDHDRWYHLAWTYDGTTHRMFINGELRGSLAGSSVAADILQSTPRIGGINEGSYAFNGQLSNFRVVQGQAVYTSSFRPSNRPLTTTSQGVTGTNCKVLCCNNSNILNNDGALGNLTNPDNGTITASTQTPFVDPASLVFGENKDQGIIKCGVFKGNGSGGTNGPKIHLGWEPSYVLWKNADSYTDWEWQDNMRRTSNSDQDSLKLEPNTDHAEEAVRRIEFTATGFDVINSSTNVNEDNKDIIYMAIRREDGYVMKAPSAANKVFTIVGPDNSNPTIGPMKDSGFPVDFGMIRQLGAQTWYTSARLKDQQYFRMDSEAGSSNYGNFAFDYQDGWVSHSSYAGSGYHSWMWRRWKGMDVSTFWGDGQSGHQIPHSLNAVPEMMWLKDLDSSSNKWNVYHKGAGAGTDPEDWYILMTNGSSGEYTPIWNDTAPTATHFTVGNYNETNQDGHRFVMMLFASGNDINGNLISKCGYYAGDNGTDRAINVGFEPRYLLVKCLEGSHWQCLDKTRGWGSGNDALLELSSNSAEDSNYNLSNPTSTGFTIKTNDVAWNESGKNYIYYAHK
jgi:hypothetical protein